MYILIISFSLWTMYYYLFSKNSIINFFVISWMVIHHLWKKKQRLCHIIKALESCFLDSEWHRTIYHSAPVTEAIKFMGRHDSLLYVTILAEIERRSCMTSALDTCLVVFFIFKRGPRYAIAYAVDSFSTQIYSF